MTAAAPNSEAAHPERMLTLRSGGWVLVLAALITLVLAAWALAPALLRERPPGDGRNASSYGFDLSNLTVPNHLVVPAMLHRGMVVTMDDPPVITLGELPGEARGKYVVSTDRVIGVTIAGESRAYPISVLHVHEIVHDELGGVPIAVTYNWPSGCAAVFDRRVDGRTLSFGVSGLLFNSNLLMYDHDSESLWSQMRSAAVSGPRVGAALERVDFQLTDWARWREANPRTTIVGRDPSIVARRYKKADPDAYFQRGEIVFGAEPLPPADGPSAMEPVIAVTTTGGRRVYPMSLLLERADASGVYVDDLAGTTVRLAVDPRSRTALATSPDGDIDVEYAVWFAWHAAHPADALAE